MNAFKDWFLQLNAREQIMVAVCGLAIVVFSAYLFVLSPMAKKAAQAEKNKVSALSEKQEVRTLASKLLARNQQGSNSTASSSMTDILNRTLRKYQLSMDDFRPSGDSVRVRISSADLNKVFAWLDELENQLSIQVKDVSITRTDVPGVASVNLRLSKG